MGYGWPVIEVTQSQSPKTGATMFARIRAARANRIAARNTFANREMRIAAYRLAAANLYS